MEKIVSEDKYAKMKKLAVKLCSVFGSKHICDAAFSNMNFIKNKYRFRLTGEHVHYLIRISCTSLTRDFGLVAQSKECHFPH
jgi:hypothetical protein